MARSAEQVLRSAIVSDLMHWFKFGNGKLLKDDNCATNIGKLRALEGYCRQLQEYRKRKIAPNQEE